MRKYFQTWGNRFDAVVTIGCVLFFFFFLFTSETSKLQFFEAFSEEVFFTLWTIV